MKVAVLFFGATADIARTRLTEVEIAEGSTAGELIESLRAHYPGLIRQKLLFALDQEYVDPETLLENGSEVAVFTPVSGG